MGTKRKGTGYKGIYLNEKTEKYDVKYNYTVVIDGKTSYRSKWKCGVPTLSDGIRALSELKSSVEGTVPATSTKPQAEPVTLKRACELWENKAKAQNLSPITIKNTWEHFKMITQIIPEDTLVAEIDEEKYYDFAAKARGKGYSEETIMVINGALRKLINLCYKRRLIPENVLNYCDNVRTMRKDDYRVITKEEYDRIDAYYAKNVGKMRNCACYRFLFALLYYTGIRIGEALALTYDDFKPFQYVTAGGLAEGIRVSVTKSYIPTLKIVKVPKNFKTRQIPLASHPIRLLEGMRTGNDPADTSIRICRISYPTIDKALKRACNDLGLPPYHLHEFRHSFISYLISKNIPITVIEKLSGDTQATILSRYSHCFDNSDGLVISALEEL
ncbi:MAG: site-specific integrase [Lachnospiraceae bacterium]|nr:site-specific integrase [Lachnospiraceae bacterium]